MKKLNLLDLIWDKQDVKTEIIKKIILVILTVIFGLISILLYNVKNSITFILFSFTSWLTLTLIWILVQMPKFQKQQEIFHNESLKKEQIENYVKKHFTTPQEIYLKKKNINKYSNIHFSNLDQIIFLNFLNDTNMYIFTAKLLNSHIIVTIHCKDSYNSSNLSFYFDDYQVFLDYFKLDEI